MREKRRTAKTAGLAAVVILLLVPPLTAPLPKSDEPMVLRIGTTDQVKSANLLLDSNLSLFAHISNPTLMKINLEVRPEGQLLSAIEPSEDLKTWRLELKPDLSWSDGRPVTSGDIGFTLIYLSEKYPAAFWLKAFLAEVSILDAHTAVVRLTRPYARLDIEFLTYPLLPKHVWEGIPNPLRHTNTGPIVGCGPFVIERTDLNRGVVSFVKNPHWKGPEPQIDAVEIHFFTNRDVLALALERGDVDVFYEYASSYPYANLGRLEGTGRFAFLERLNLALYFLGFNLKRAPLSDPAFRQAVAFAIDYEEIRHLVLLGHGEIPQLGFVPPSMPGHKATRACVLDLSKARRLLDEAGYTDRDQNGFRENRDGQEIRLTLLVDPAKAHNARLAELVSEYLRSMGLRISVKSVEGSTWITLKDRYEYDLVIARTSAWGMLMHASWATGYFDSRRTGDGVLHTVDDAAFLELCDRLLATTDPGASKGLAGSVQDYYSAHLPAVPLFWNTIITPYNREFSGWALDPLYGLYNIDTLLNVRRETP